MAKNAKKAKKTKRQKGKEGEEEVGPRCIGRQFRPRSSSGASFRKQSAMTKLMSQSELVQKIADQRSLPKKDVKSIIELLASVGYPSTISTGPKLVCKREGACGGRRVCS